MAGALSKIRPDWSLSDPTPFVIISQNLSGWWATEDATRTLKLALTLDLLKRADILCIQEAHVEPEDIPFVESWARRNGLRVFFGLSAFSLARISAPSDRSDQAGRLDEEHDDYCGLMGGFSSLDSPDHFEVPPVLLSPFPPPPPLGLHCPGGTLPLSLKSIGLGSVAPRLIDHRLVWSR
jgi:hypothetical protein